LAGHVHEGGGGEGGVGSVTEYELTIVRERKRAPEVQLFSVRSVGSSTKESYISAEEP